jgi:hypothetical protein
MNEEELKRQLESIAKQRRDRRVSDGTYYVVVDGILSKYRASLNEADQDKPASEPPPDLCERATAVLRARTAAHGQQKEGKIATARLDLDFSTLGGIWRCILENAFKMPIPPIPSWLACTMLAALKVWKMSAATGEQFDDSCIDLINYTRIAHKLRTWRDSKLAEENASVHNETVHETDTQGVQKEYTGPRWCMGKE